MKIWPHPQHEGTHCINTGQIVALSSPSISTAVICSTASTLVSASFETGDDSSSRLFHTTLHAAMKTMNSSTGPTHPPIRHLYPRADCNVNEGPREDDGGPDEQDGRHMMKGRLLPLPSRRRETFEVIGKINMPIRLCSRGAFPICLCKSNLECTHYHHGVLTLFGF